MKNHYKQSDLITVKLAAIVSCVRKGFRVSLIVASTRSIPIELFNEIDLSNTLHIH